MADVRYYCGCHGIEFTDEDGVCPSCRDEWEELPPEGEDDDA